MNKTLNRWTKAVEACERKACYDQEEATTVAILRSVEETTTAAQYTAYRCIVCGCWHVGHTRKQQQQQSQKAS